jgi:hypothetical protein
MEAKRKLVFLCHALCVTLSGEQPARPRSKCYIKEIPSLGGSGHVALCVGLGWRHRPSRGRGLGLGFSSIGSLRLGQAPET